MHKFPLISIQILNWNRAKETLRAIQSALEQTYSNIEIVVIDNGSIDDSVHLIKKNFPMVKLFELGKNFGCPGGRNRGIEHCTGDFIFYLDNDGVLHSEAVMNAFLTISKGENIGIVTGILYDFNFESEIDTRMVVDSAGKYEFNNFQGGISMHRKSIYDVIDKYPDHFMYGGEELYLSLKLINSGLLIIKDESVVLWHKKSTLARNKQSEMLSSFLNKLYITIALYPLIPMLSFVMYFLIIYPFYAIRSNMLYGFVVKMKKELINTTIDAFKHREPITYKSFFNHRSYAKEPFKRL